MSGHARADFALYNTLLDEGLAREQARIVIPLSSYTEWYWKIDLHNLLHFLDLRCDSHAQKEIQVYGNAILSLISPLVPYTIEAWEDYSTYRGGMVLTKYEVEALRNLISNESGNDSNFDTQELKVDSKLEKREWAEKKKRLGFIKGE